ncbi:MAG: hypothetical protein HY904_03025 [Deltaproteobacteria bacterium]|nr:hypothetical protein [Deltaproteobacteria bacterium]
MFELRGLLRGRMPAKILFGGGAARLQEVRQFLFHGAVETREIGPASPFHLGPRLAREADPAVHALLWDAWPWEHSAAGTYVVQAWLDAHADPGPDWERNVKSRVNETVAKCLRRAERLGCTFSTSRDGSELERFYNEMVLPTALARYGEDVFLADVGTFLARGAGEDRILLKVQRDGMWLAGSVVVFAPERSEAWMLNCGMASTVLADRALTAEVNALKRAWVFKEASRRGLRVNLALTRPFLDDGVFDNKRRWGCWLQQVPALPRYRMQLAPQHVDGFLRVAPFFHLAPDGVRGVLAFAPSLPDAVEELRARLNACVFPGLRGLTVRVAGGAELLAELSRAVPAVKGCGVSYQAAGPEQRAGAHAGDLEMGGRPAG